MKSQISSIDLHYLINELQFLVGGKIDKIYHPLKEELLIQFHVTGKGKQLLRIISGKFIFLSVNKENYDTPSGFCMFLRKKLNNARLREIIQEGSERMTRLVFETKEGTFNLYVELFGKGNIILTDKENKIINALQQQKWTDRTIMKDEIYKFPKKDFNLFNIKEKDFNKILEPDKEVVLKLAKDIGLGGIYAEEICIRAGIDKKNKKLNDKEKESILKEFKKIINSKIGAVIYYKKDNIKDIVPFEISTYKELEKKEFDSFNAAFDEFFVKELATKTEFQSKHQSEINKTAKIVEQQKAQIKSLEKKAEDNNKKGEIIYEKYQLVDEILKEINKARKTLSFDEIKKKLKDHKIIKDVDGKNKKVSVEL